MRKVARPDQQMPGADCYGEPEKMAKNKMPPSFR
jgi:hypothetical protein